MKLSASPLVPLVLALVALVADVRQAIPRAQEVASPPPTSPGKLACTARGTALAKALDSLNVETHWLAGQHINDWRTGRADKRTGGPRTHCSLFVAAVCQKLRVPMLNPPPQTFLSNRQQEWLVHEGRDKGWRRVKNPVEAQRLANQGVLVLASYQNPEPKKAGHIAVVRPAAATAAEVRERGPWITQAGTRNYRKTDTRTAFRHHPGAWKNSEIRYFAYRPTGAGDGTPASEPSGATPIQPPDDE